VSDKDDEAGEIIKKLVELDEDILREARLPYHEQDHKRLKKLKEDRRSLRYRLKRLDKE